MTDAHIEPLDVNEAVSEQIGDALREAQNATLIDLKLEALQRAEELLLTKDHSGHHLDNFLDEMMEFSQSMDVALKCFVATFIEKACKKDPEVMKKAILILSSLLLTGLTKVQKQVIRVSSNLYPVVLKWAVGRRMDQDAEKCWEAYCVLKGRIIQLIDVDNEGIRTMTLKFLESVVLAQSMKTDECESGRGDLMSLGEVSRDHRYISYRKMQTEATYYFQTLIEQTTVSHISAQNLLTALSSICLIARQRTEFMGKSVDALEVLHVNLPPTLGTSQVKSVRKELKMHMLRILRHPSSFPLHNRIITLLTDLGATTNEMNRYLPANIADLRKKNKRAGEGDEPMAKKSKTDDDEAFRPLEDDEYAEESTSQQGQRGSSTAQGAAINTPQEVETLNKSLDQRPSEDDVAVLRTELVHAQKLMDEISQQKDVEIQEHLSSIRMLSMEREKAHCKMENLEKAVAETGSVSKDSTERIVKLSSELDELKRENESSMKELISARTEVDEKDKRIVELQSRIEGNIAELTTCREKISQLEETVRKGGAEIEDSHILNEKNQQKLIQLGEKLEQMIEEKKRYETDVGGMEEKQTEQSENIQKLELANLDLTNELSSLGSLLEQERNLLTEKNALIGERDKELHDVRGILEEKEVEITRVRAELDEKEKDRAALQTQISVLQANSKELMNKVSEGEGGAKMAIDHLTEEKRKLAEDIIVLGNSIKEQKEESAKKLEEASRKMREAEKSSAEKVKKLSDEKEELVRRLRESDEEVNRKAERFVEMEKECEEERRKTGERVGKLKEIIQQKEASAAEMRKQLEELSSQVEERDRQLREKERHLEDSKARIEDSVHRLEEAQEKARALVEKEMLQLEVLKTQSEVTKMSTKVDTLNKSLDQRPSEDDAEVWQRLAEFDKVYGQLKTSVEKVTDELKMKQLEIEEIQREYERKEEHWKRRKEEFERQLEKNQETNEVEKLNKETKITHLESTCEELNTRIAELETGLGETRTSSSAQLEAIVMLTKEKEELQSNNEVLKGRLDKESTALKASSERQVLLEKEVGHLQQELADKRSTVDKLELKSKQFEKMTKDIQFTMEALLSKVNIFGSISMSAGDQ